MSDTWPTDEPQAAVEATFVEATPEAVPTAAPGPVRDVVATPAAASVLVEWDAPSDDGGTSIDRVDVFEHETRDRGVERAVGKRQRGSAGTGVVRSPVPVGGDAHTVPGRVDPDHVGSLARCEAADLAVTTPDVEHAPGPVEFGRRKRHDLLDVLRIGTLGETVDPPVGVGFPQVVRHRGEGTGSQATVAA